MNRWHEDSRTCSHSNADVCRTCDFDGYYARKYDDCPWRERDCDHYWLDRPESDTHVCEMCGLEGSGPPPT